MVARGLKNPLKNPQYAYIGPTYGQAKKVAWDILKDILRKIPGSVVNEAELRVDIPRPEFQDRVRFYLVGAENVDGLRGMYFDGVVLDEFAIMDPRIWSEIILPALSDLTRERPGNQWAIFIGTPKGENHFFSLWKHAEGKPDWYRIRLGVSETAYVSTAALAAVRSAGMSEAEYDQEYECSFSAAMVGAYYGDVIRKAERDGRILDFPYERRSPVQTAWDLGKNDSTAIWFYQNVGHEIRFLHYHEENGKDLPHFGQVVRATGYFFEMHNLPHDARADMLGMPKSREAQIRDLKIGPIQVVPRHGRQAGIQAARAIFPRCYFHATGCAKGLEALRHYQKSWDAVKMIFSDEPLHNWASNGADAFRIFAMAERPAVQERELPRHYDSNYNELAW
jgi:hypothetical protein